MTFEPNTGQLNPRVQFLGRGRGLSVFLTKREIAIRPAASASHLLTLRLSGGAKFSWYGAEKLRGQSNYFIGKDSRRWHTAVSHFSRAESATRMPGLTFAVYGNAEGLEYDLRLAPGTPSAPRPDASKLRLEISGAGRMHLAPNGDLLLETNGAAVRMKKPVICTQRLGTSERIAVDGGYVLESDGSLGFRIGPHDSSAALVIDPSISVTYATFLGGEGADSATSIAADSQGNIYVAGTTASAATFAESPGARLGPTGGPSEFFVAKIDPSASPADSLVYLTFLGGSGMQLGGAIAVDGSGDVAITGTTTSADFPVTDSTQPTSGLTSGSGNDVAVSELNPTGNALVFSTLFGGSGAESQNGSGGIALDSSGTVYIASDVGVTKANPSSADLPVTSGAYQTTWDGEQSDAFLSIFTPPTQAGGAATLIYCSYLNLASFGPASVGGVAVDSSGSAYIAGSTVNSGNGFPATNALPNVAGGGASDAFVMKISPVSQGSSDLVFATLLGGSSSDQAFAVAVDSLNPPDIYVAGTTQSANFPTNGEIAPFQSAFSPTQTNNAPTAVAFFTVIGQGPTGATSLIYSTLLGGSGNAEEDVAQALAVVAPNIVYVAGSVSASSENFPWHDNVQPFNGAGDAFVAKFDPTASGSASLKYATPLGGTSPPGTQASAAASAIAADASGHVYIAGSTTSADFPTAITSSGAALNSPQPVCASCWESPAAPDAFVVELTESSTSMPAVAFSFSSLPAFSSFPQLEGLINTGDSALNITGVQLLGPNAEDFQIQVDTCAGQSISPGNHCSFELAFTPTATGFETARLAVADNAPGSPQELELTGIAPGVDAAPASLSFPPQPLGTSSAPQQITFSVGPVAAQVPHVDSLPALTGPDAAQFQAVSPNSCTAAVLSMPSGSCLFNVIFAPQAAGTFHAAVSLSFDLQGGSVQTLSVPLSGTATQAPAIGISPTSLDFGSQLAGTSGPSQPITVMNAAPASGGSLSFSTVNITGTNSGDFILASNTTGSCVGATVMPGGSCTVQVAFKPAPASTCGSEPTRTAMLSLADNASGSPQLVPLTGTAADFCFVSVIVAPITQGQTAAYNLAVNSFSGFSGSVAVAVSCASLQSAEGNCSLSASSVNVAPNASNSSGQFSVTITTTAPSSSAGVIRPKPHHFPRAKSFTVEAVLAMFLALISALGALKWQICAPKTAALAALVFAFVLGVAACGGTSPAADPNLGTAPTTYPVVVTATYSATPANVVRTLTLNQVVEASSN